MDTYKILIVDDDPLQRLLLRDVLNVSGLIFELEEAKNGQEALEKCKLHDFDAILTDKHMPVMDGDEVCRIIRKDISSRFVPILMVSGSTSSEAIVQSFAAGASDFVQKPYRAVELFSRIKSAVEKKRLTDQLDSAESLLFALARMVEAKDKTTGDHCSRLAHMGVVFGNEIGLSRVQIEALRCGGVLHDIGKLGIPDSILLKDSPLNDSEWVLMREHTTIGANLCQGLSTMKHVVPIILHHHEKWDGSGYPHRLTGHDIPYLARIFQVIDIYDALASKRPYKKSMSHEEIVAVMQEEANKGWRDPELIGVFLDFMSSHLDSMRLPDKQEKTRDEIIFNSISATGVLDWDNKTIQI